jgi:NADP-dependent 3-hydroxy acid dehydrogenase YdfG
MQRPLKVFITGSNRGIGFELGKTFLRLNPNASIYATSIEKLEIASKQWKAFDHDNRVKCMYLDVTSKQNIAEVVHNIER